MRSSRDVNRLRGLPHDDDAGMAGIVQELLVRGDTGGRGPGLG